MKLKSKKKPSIAPKWDYIKRDARGFMQRTMAFMVKEKYLSKFIDFGSGVPIRGNVHEIVQAINPEAKVIYSDKDPIAIALGQKILEDTPNVRYIYCDVEKPRALLGSPVVDEFFGNDKKVGIGFVGVFLYVPDEPLIKFFELLYNWVDPGSHIAVTCVGHEFREIEEMVQAYKRMNLVFYSRSNERIKEIIGPWKLTRKDLSPGLYWGLPSDSSEINKEISNFSYCFMAYK